MEDKGYKRIKDWQPDDRPRERLLKHGSASLSDSELLAIILRTGTKDISAKDLGVKLLRQFGDFASIEKIDISDLMKIKGIGKTKAITLAAVFEIARRTKIIPFERKKIIRQPDDVAQIFIHKLGNLATEEFHVVLLSTANTMIKDVLVSKGSLNASIVHAREVFKPAISEMAAAVILVHNHPSGNPQPSAEDKKITKRLIEAGKLLDINVFDHLIIAGENYYSFAADGEI
jgi:DNA repair protein RadC